MLYDSYISEDWAAVNHIEKYVHNQEILSVTMLDHNNTISDIKEKYLLILMAEGVFMSIKLQTPLHSDTYLRALMILDDDQLFEIVLTLAFVAFGIISWLLKRRNR